MRVLSTPAYLLLAATVIAGLCWYMGLFAHLDAPPSGLHFIRQTDVLSFVTRYEDQPLTRPATLNLSSHNGQAVGELPLTYFAAAKCSGLVKDEAVSLRIIHCTIALVGLLLFSLTARALTSSSAAAVLITSLPFTSVMFVYYADNFLPDIVALALTLAATAFMWNGNGKQSPHRFVAGMVLLTAASLFKVTYGIYLIAWIAALAMQRPPARLPLRVLTTSCAVAFLSIVGWNLWVRSYNQANGSDYFLTNSTPVWEMHSGEISETWMYITGHWAGAYIYPSAYWLLLVAAVAFLALRKRIATTLWRFIALSAVGVLSIGALFFFKLRDHDYYLLVAWPVVVLLIASVTGVALQHLRSNYHRPAILGGLLLAVIAGIIYTEKKISKRRTARTVQEIFSPEEYTELKADPGASVLFHAEHPLLVIGDPTPNGSLWYLGSKGLTCTDTTDARDALDILHGLDNDVIIISRKGSPGENWLKDKTVPQQSGAFVFGSVSDR